MARKWNPPRLGEALPELAEEIERDLDDRPDLKAQVRDLPMLSLCGCEDSFCASFNTGDKSRVVDETTVGGRAILDVPDGRIVYVEIIEPDYSEFRDQVRALFGKPPEANMEGV